MIMRSIIDSYVNTTSTASSHPCDGKMRQYTHGTITLTFLLSVLGNELTADVSLSPTAALRPPTT